MRAFFFRRTVSCVCGWWSTCRGVSICFIHVDTRDRLGDFVFKKSIGGARMDSRNYYDPKSSISQLLPDLLSAFDLMVPHGYQRAVRNPCVFFCDLALLVVTVRSLLDKNTQTNEDVFLEESWVVYHKWNIKRHMSHSLLGLHISNLH